MDHTTFAWIVCVAYVLGSVFLPFFAWKTDIGAQFADIFSFRQRSALEFLIVLVVVVTWFVTTIANFKELPIEAAIIALFVSMISFCIFLTRSFSD